MQNNTFDRDITVTNYSLNKMKPRNVKWRTDKEKRFRFFGKELEKIKAHTVCLQSTICFYLSRGCLSYI